MERESFENEEIGRLLNDSFVSIKVDREERPDVDRVYMTFVQVCAFKCRLSSRLIVNHGLDLNTFFAPRTGKPYCSSVQHYVSRLWHLLVDCIY